MSVTSSHSSRVRKHHTLLWAGLVIGLSFWVFDSCVHRYLYGESRFEWIPSDFNELWMRGVICLLFILFGWYASVSKGRQIELDFEREVESRMTNSLTAALGGFLPICAQCKSVRSGEDDWIQIEKYIRDRTSTVFSHSLCPSCAAKLYPNLTRDR
jgi:hypothetical protein